MADSTPAKKPRPSVEPGRGGRSWPRDKHAEDVTGWVLHVEEQAISEGLDPVIAGREFVVQYTACPPEDRQRNARNFAMDALDKAPSTRQEKVVHDQKDIDTTRSELSQPMDKVCLLPRPPLPTRPRPPHPPPPPPFTHTGLLRDSSGAYLSVRTHNIVSLG